MPSGKSESGTSRLGSVGGENRYQLWSSAIREFDSDPLTGTGSGTFQLWWTRDGSVPTPILDTHSLYLQTLGELGTSGWRCSSPSSSPPWPGAPLRLLRTGGSRRAWLAAALGGSTVLWTTSVFDWTWKIPIIPIVTLLLAAVAVTAGDPDPEERAALSLPLRAGASRSRRGADRDRDPAGIQLADPPEPGGRSRRRHRRRPGRRPSAQNVQPGAATPRLQEALLSSPRPLRPAETAAGPRPNVSRPTGEPGYCCRGSRPRTNCPTRRSATTAGRGT